MIDRVGDIKKASSFKTAAKFKIPNCAEKMLIYNSIIL